jgi:methionine-gamma-lyase
MAAAVFAIVRAGDHVLCIAKPYSWTRSLLRDLLPKFGVATSFVDGTDVVNFEKALTAQTRLIVLESPNTMTYEQQDLAAVAALARGRGIRTICDNSFATPLNQSPIAFGIDLVVHSATKYLNGHSDVVAGIVVANEEKVVTALRSTATSFGLTIDPHQAWLVLRGIRTLGMRVERAQASAIEIAGWLEKHEMIEWVRFPGLPSHPQYELAQRQMSGPGSVLAFELRGGLEAGRILMNNVRLITLAVSLGGVESLIEHPASMTHKAVPAHEQLEQGITPGLVRLSVGCEDVRDIRADLEQALVAVAAEAAREIASA